MASLAVICDTGEANLASTKYPYSCINIRAFYLKYSWLLPSGSHTHIFKIKIFNQNYTFKSIKLLDGSEKERVLTKSRELCGDTRYDCLLLHFKAMPIRFTSCHGLAWNFPYLNLLNRLILD